MAGVNNIPSRSSRDDKTIQYESQNQRMVEKAKKELQENATELKRRQTDSAVNQHVRETILQQQYRYPRETVNKNEIAEPTEDTRRTMESIEKSKQEEDRRLEEISKTAIKNIKK